MLLDRSLINEVFSVLQTKTVIEILLVRDVMRMSRQSNYAVVSTR